MFGCLHPQALLLPSHVLSVYFSVASAGVGMALRKIASIQNPCVEVTDNGDGSYTIKQITTFKTHAVDFVLDKELEENTPDGRKVKVSYM